MECRRSQVETLLCTPVTAQTVFLWLMMSVHWKLTGATATVRFSADLLALYLNVRSALWSNRACVSISERRITGRAKATRITRQRYDALRATRISVKIATVTMSRAFASVATLFPARWFVLDHGVLGVQRICTTRTRPMGHRYVRCPAMAYLRHWCLVVSARGCLEFAP